MPSRERDREIWTGWEAMTAIHVDDSTNKKSKRTTEINNITGFRGTIYGTKKEEYKMWMKIVFKADMEERRHGKQWYVMEKVI